MHIWPFLHLAVVFTKRKQSMFYTRPLKLIYKTDRFRFSPVLLGDSGWASSVAQTTTHSHFVRITSTWLKSYCFQKSRNFPRISLAFYTSKNNIEILPKIYLLNNRALSFRYFNLVRKHRKQPIKCMTLRASLFTLEFIKRENLKKTRGFWERWPNNTL